MAREQFGTNGGETVRVAILSDTHGVVDARIAARVVNHDIAVHAGDIGSTAVLSELAPRSGVVVAVRGNNDVPDKWHADEHAALAAIPWEERLSLPGGDLVVVHGHRAGSAARRHCWLRAHFRDARAIVYGHSHRSCIDKDARPWVLNPGAAGKARTFGGPSFVSLSISQQRWRLKLYRFER